MAPADPTRTPTLAELGRRVTHWVMDHARLVVWTMVSSTLLLVALALLPSVAPGTFSSLKPIAVDTDPENMLPADEPARVNHRLVKEQFGLHDGIVLGIVNETHPDGVFNVQTLAKVHALSEHAKGLDGVVAHDVLSIATIDDIRHESAGTIRFNWLMPNPPRTAEEARDVRARAMRIPLVYDTLVSADARTAVVFVPLTDKHVTRDVAAALEARMAELGDGDDRFHLAGLPVAEETFGIEMFKQMAISAPIAMVVIFLLMWLFFRNVRVIAAPMIVAMVAALSTMGLLVATGNTIHIMSSMIPIFIMPVAVLDAIHIISDFFERYPKKRDRKATMLAVMDELTAPMLFTSLTTATGFASLALTPIPPVQVFGVFVAVGVLLAWLWTVTFIPAYVALMSPERLESFGRATKEREVEGRLGRLINGLTHRRAHLVLAGAVGLIGVAGFGISKIEINDNPIRWFEPEHPIREADRVLNSHFGGTHEVYLTVRAKRQPYTAQGYAEALRRRAQSQADAVAGVFAALDQKLTARDADDAETFLDAVDGSARSERKRASEDAAAGWSAVIGFLEAEYARLEDAGDSDAQDDAFDAATFRAALRKSSAEHAKSVAAGYARLLTRIDETAAQKPEDEESFRAALAFESDDAADQPAVAFVAQAAQHGEVFKDPASLEWVARLESALAEMTGVGKTNSLAGVVKTVHRDLLSGKEDDYRLPRQRAMVAETLEQFTASHRKDDLWHFVTPDYRDSIVWIQLTNADNQVMEALQQEAAAWLDANPPPPGLERPTWSGLTYINAIWQQQMVSGMRNAFLGSFLVVLLMMIALFRSVWWGVLSMVPLTITVGLCYGIIGLVGKHYDMPVAVLSSLALGLAVDYAIHFIARSREYQRRLGSWEKARHAVFGEPARAIVRNAIVVGVGFLPLILAPLVPYQTVGVLIASMLLLAGAGTLVLLPAIIAAFERRLFSADASPSVRPVRAS